MSIWLCPLTAGTFRVLKTIVVLLFHATLIGTAVMGSIIVTNHLCGSPGWISVAVGWPLCMIMGAALADCMDRLDEN